MLPKLGISFELCRVTPGSEDIESFGSSVMQHYGHQKLTEKTSPPVRPFVSCQCEYTSALSDLSESLKKHRLHPATRNGSILVVIFSSRGIAANT